MGGDQIYAEILASIARVETTTKQLEKNMGEICEFKEEMIKTRQEFEDYKRLRHDIPKDLQNLTDRVNKGTTTCEHHETIVTDLSKKVDFLMTWYGRLAAVIVSIQIIIAIMVAAGRFIDVQYVLK
jgi:chromosome segregation ATPase